MAEQPSTSDITALLRRFQAGDRVAEEQLAAAVYPELKRIAARQLRGERKGHTLQTTALAHEAFLKLVNAKTVDWNDRAHFFAVAARMTRQIVLDYARHFRAQKREGGRIRIPLDDALAFSPERSIEVIALDEALTCLSESNEQAGRIVELRFFGGLSVEETAEVMGISERSVKRKWSVARAWLHGRLRPQAEHVDRTLAED